MKPKKTEPERQRELFKVELDAHHPLVQLGGRINWARFEEQLTPSYHDKIGSPRIDTS